MGEGGNEFTRLPVVDIGLRIRGWWVDGKQEEDEIAKYLHNW